MPIGLDELRRPSWVTYKTRYPISEDKKDRFNTICPRNHMARYNGDRDTGWKQAGYNPNHNSKRIESINLLSDDITMRPR